MLNLGVDNIIMTKIPTFIRIVVSQLKTNIDKIIMIETPTFVYYDCGFSIKKATLNMYLLTKYKKNSHLFFKLRVHLLVLHYLDSLVMLFYKFGCIATVEQGSTWENFACSLRYMGGLS